MKWRRRLGGRCGAQDMRSSIARFVQARQRFILQERAMQKKARRSGFTLPEVLVTVTVVAVLAAVVVPAVTQYVGKGGNPASASDLDQLRNAITGYVADNRTFPGYVDALSAATPAHGEAALSFHGPYLSSTVSASTG